MPVTPAQYITSLQRLEPGALWIWQTAQRIHENHLRYTNENTPRPDLSTNWYRFIADFWRDALWGEPPHIAEADDAMRELIDREFAIAQRWRSVAGVGVIAVNDASDVYPTRPLMQAIQPEYYVPIVEETDTTIVVGHIIAYPYRSVTRDTNANDSIIAATMPPDRIAMHILHPPSPPTLRITKYDSGNIGQIMSEQLSPISEIVAFGDWFDDYKDLEPIIDRYQAMLHAVDRSLSRHVNPHLQGPDATIDPSLNVGDGLLLPRLGDDPPWAYVQTNSDGYESAAAYLTELRDLIRTLGKLPPTSVNTGSSGSRLFPQSASSQERQLFTTLQRIRTLRSEAKAAIHQVGNALGTPFTVDWPDNPFATFAERAGALEPLIEPGVYSPAEVRERLDD